MGGGVPRRLGGGPLGARRLSAMILGCVFDDFRLHLGTLEGHFGVILEPESPTWSVYVDFSMFFLVPLKRERKSYPKSSKKEPFGRRSTWLKCSK